MPDNIILLLHIDPQERAALSDLLHNSCELITADTGEEGIALSRKHSPALIILDQELKGMDVHTFLEQLAASPHDECPVIALANDCLPEESSRYYQSGVSNLLKKPVNTRELSELAQILMSRSAHARAESFQLKQYRQLLQTYAASSHTMKNYINSVRGFVENMKWSKNDAETLNELLDDKNLAQVLNILKELAEFSRVVMQDSLPDQWLSDTIDVGKLIREKLICFKFGKKSSKIRLEVRLPETAEVLVKGNRFLLSSALENILGNARDEVIMQYGAWSEKYLEVDYDKAMVSTEEPDIIISVQSERDLVMIRVCNVGRTIPHVDKPKIFERGITFKPGGTGIGLYDSRNVVRDMGGDIHVEDFGGKGACFSIKLPAMVESADTATDGGIQK